jgi:hypothetical protein
MIRRSKKMSSPENTVIFRWPLGAKAKDKITGFEGTICARSNHITGCDTYGLAPPVDKDGKTRDWGWFDEGRLEILPDPEQMQLTDVESKSGRGATESIQPNLM